MLFQPEHIEAIRAGDKTETRRDWAEGYHRPEAGDIRMATTQMFQSDDECDCYIRVTDHYREPLGELNAAAADAEGGYTVAEFEELWAEMHGSWEPEMTADVIEFEYIGRSRPGGDA